MAAMRLKMEREHGGWLLRMWLRWTEVAYFKLALSGLGFSVEFPSTWHEPRKGWVRIGLGFCHFAFAFPWPWAYQDHHQCSGPRFGFQFYEDLLFLYYGNDTGYTATKKTKGIYMPWAWKHRLHEVLSEPEAHPYAYTLRSGEVQHRTATIKAERRTWTRWWLPYRRVSNAIDVTFSDEVGERSGSWKGGIIRCGYEMRPGETPLMALRRMEAERKF